MRNNINMKKMSLFLIIIFIAFSLFVSSGNKEQKVEFVAVGDNIIHTAVYNDAYEDGKYNFEKMYENVRPIIKSADISFINQETICSPYAPSGYPLFSTPDDIAKSLKNVGFNVVNISNNHMLDMDTQKTGGGYAHSIDLWQNSGLTLIGGYKTEEEAHKGKTIEKNGIKITFLSYTYGTNVTLEENTTPYVAYMDKDTIISDLQNAKKSADCVILSLHWGEENATEPSSEQRSLAKVFAENGADVILGHHSHIVQDIEYVSTTRGKTLVAYSLGNFLSAQTKMENLVGGILKFTVIKEKSGISVDNSEFIPTVCHYIQDETKKIDLRKNIKIYLLKDYTKELSLAHGANDYYPFDLDLLYANCKGAHLSISLSE